MDTGKAEKADMASKIQRSWRGFFARRARNVKLFDRETKYREASSRSSRGDVYFMEQCESGSGSHRKRSTNAGGARGVRRPTKRFAASRLPYGAEAAA